MSFYSLGEFYLLLVAIFIMVQEGKFAKYYENFLFMSWEMSKHLLIYNYRYQINNNTCFIIYNYLLSFSVPNFTNPLILLFVIDVLRLRFLLQTSFEDCKVPW